jgi:NAD(P)-dependent dehydrogenase (short-subunit alcohol dehydrogenase family)
VLGSARLVEEAAAALGGLDSVISNAGADNHFSTGLDLLVDGGLGSSILNLIPGAPPKN